MKRVFSRRTAPFVLAAGLVLLALVGWFAAVAPQRAKSSSLERQIAETQNELRSLQLQPRGASHAKVIKVADVFRLSKAIPDKVQMPDILLELNRIAGESGITFASITPHAPAVTGFYQVVPIDVVFRGNYYNLSDFLYRVRNLVEIHDGLLQTTGRLFTVDHLSFGQGEKAFPLVDATLTIDAYVYGPGATGLVGAAGAVPPGSTTTGTSTSATTTTSTSATTTSPAPSPAPAGATAAGVNP